MTPSLVSAAATSSPDLVVDGYHSGDAPAIVDCLRATFGDPLRLERWQHLHLANPAGESVIVLARAEGRVVGQIANLRRRVRFFESERTVAHVLDTMVHPSWQRRGIFQQLVVASESAVTTAGLDVSYGVANDVALHGAAKYERRRPLGAFPVLVRPLRPLASLAAISRHWFERGDSGGSVDVPECAAAGPLAEPSNGPRLADASRYSWQAPAFDARHSRLFAAATDLPPIAFVRDAAHLGWRYPTDGDGPYVQRDILVGDAIAATAIVRVITVAGLRLLLVMEWHWRAGAADVGRRLAQDILVLARRAETHGIAAMAPPRSLPRRILRSLGFLAVPALAFPQHAWPGVHARGDTATDLRWSIPTNWYFTWGDGLVL